MTTKDYKDLKKNLKDLCNYIANIFNFLFIFQEKSTREIICNFLSVIYARKAMWKFNQQTYTQRNLDPTSNYWRINGH